MKQTLKHWLGGIRLYIAIAIAVVTAEAWWWAHVVYGSDSTGTIRLEEIYAWTAVMLLGLAVSIGPFLKLFPKFVGVKLLRDARRLLGIGAAWFGTLHAAIAFFGLFHAPNPLTLASVYRQAFLWGMVALVILLLMAFTSFDRAFKGMGIWWFRLHRLVYVAIITVLFHAFMIGYRAATLPVLITIATAVILVMGMHLYLFFKVARPRALQVVTVAYMVIFLAAVLNYGLSQHLGYNVLLKGHEAGKAKNAGK